MLCSCLNPEPERAFDVQLSNPLHPDVGVRSFAVQVDCDEHGIPRQYRMPLAAETCYDGKCKPMDVVLLWDGLGRFPRVEPVPGKPLTKSAKETAFTEENYEQLCSILQNSRSVLRTYPLKTFGAEENVPVDGVTGATLPFLHGEVVGGAVYTTWVLWHWANGDVIAQLEAHTRQHMAPVDVERFLLSDDPLKVRFALQMAKELGVPPDAVFQTLEKADRDTAKLALHTLTHMNIDDLNARLVAQLGSASDEAEWLIIDYIENREPDPELHAALNERMPDLTFIGKHKVKRLLQE
jgi:hypothetical protein